MYSRLTMLQNVVLSPFTELSLRLFGLKKTWTLLLWITPTATSKDSQAKILKSQLLTMKRAKRLKIVFGKCLARSLVLWWQLTRRGLSPDLVIGVQQKVDFRAHAWLELDGLPLNAGAKVRNRYTSLAVFAHPDHMT